MHWNYRIMRHEDVIPEWESHAGKTEMWYGIHEVYYASEDDSKVMSYSANAMALVSDKIENVKDLLQKMLVAFDKPILEYGMKCFEVKSNEGE